MSKSLLTTTELEAVAVQFFEDYPNHQDVYVTEDGQSFFEENRAIMHADDKGLTYKRYVRSFDEASAEPKQENTPTSDSPEYRGADPSEEKAKYEAKVKELQELELDSKNYTQLKDLVRYFGLETENMKAPTLIEALNEFKQKLSE